MSSDPGVSARLFPVLGPLSLQELSLDFLAERIAFCPR